MHIVLGATGHVGSALALALLDRNEPVMVVVHDPKKGQAWRDRGASVAVADVHDAFALRAIFKRGQRLFLLNPPAAPSTDTDVEERKSLASILSALDGSGLEKIVAESTYGAQPGTRIGDLGVLYEMEQALSAQPIPTTILRAAYYMSNWAPALATAERDGHVQTFFPVDFTLPMVAPRDIGHIAARLMMDDLRATGIRYVEGPARYRAADVAAAFSSALKRTVTAMETPQDRWIETLRGMGFSESAAESFAGMTAVALEAPAPEPSVALRGSTTLQMYVDELVRRAHAKSPSSMFAASHPW